MKATLLIAATALLLLSPPAAMAGYTPSVLTFSGFGGHGTVLTIADVELTITASDTEPFELPDGDRLGDPFDFSMPSLSTGHGGRGRCFDPDDPSDEDEYEDREDDCYVGNDDSDPSDAVPEPATLLLLGGGLIAVGAIGRRRHK